MERARSACQRPGSRVSPCKNYIPSLTLKVREGVGQKLQMTDDGQKIRVLHSYQHKKIFVGVGGIA